MFNFSLSEFNLSLSERQDFLYGGAKKCSVDALHPNCIRLLLESHNMQAPQWLKLFMSYHRYDDVIEELNKVKGEFTIGHAVAIAAKWSDDDEFNPMANLMDCFKSMVNSGAYGFNSAGCGIIYLILNGFHELLESCCKPSSFDARTHVHAMHSGNAILTNACILLGSQYPEIVETYLYRIIRLYGNLTYFANVNWVETAIEIILKHKYKPSLALDFIVIGYNQGWLSSFFCKKKLLTQRLFNNAIESIVLEKKDGYAQHVLYLCYKIMKYDPKLVDSAFVSQLLDREISLLLSQNSPLINVLNNIHGASVDKISQDRLMYLAPFVQCSLFNQSLSVVDVFKTFVPGRSIAEIIIDANHVTFLQYLPRTMASDAIEYAVKRGFPIVPSLWGILDQEGQEYLFQQGLLSRLLSYQRQGKLRLLCDFIQCCFEKNYLFIIEFLINQPGLSLPVLLHAVRYSPNVKETTSRLVEFYKGDLIELFSLAVCRVVNGKRRQRAKISPDQFVDFILTLLSMIESENNSLALLVEPIHTLYNSPFFQSTPQLASFLMAFSLRHDLQCVLTSGVSNPKLKGSLSIANETIPLFSLNQVQDRLFQVVNAFSQCERVFLHADSGYQPLTIMFKGTWLLLCHQKQILKKSGLLSTLWSFVDFQTPSCQSSASSEKPSFLCQRHNDMRLLTGMIHVDSPQKKQKGMRLNLLSSHLTFISNSKQYFSSDRNMPGNIVTPVTLLGNVANDKGSISVPHQLKLLGGIANKLVCYFEHQQARVKSKPNLALFNTRFCVLMKSIDQVKKSMRSDAMKKM